MLKDTWTSLQYKRKMLLMDIDKLVKQYNHDMNIFNVLTDKIKIYSNADNSDEMADYLKEQRVYSDLLIESINKKNALELKKEEVEQTMKNINIEKVEEAKIMVNEFLGNDGCDEETRKERAALFIKAISVASLTSNTTSTAPASPSPSVSPSVSPSPTPAPASALTVSLLAPSEIALNTSNDAVEVSCTSVFKTVGKEGISIVRNFLSTITGDDLREFKLKNVADSSLDKLSELEEQNVIIVLAYNGSDKVVGFYLGYMTTENKTHEVKITLKGHVVYVLPSERRSGFGANMNRFFQKAFETKVAELKLPNGPKVTVQRWVFIFLNNKIAMQFWKDQGYNKGESFYVDIHDYDKIVENYNKNEESLSIIKKENQPDMESSTIVDEEDLSNKLNFSDDELAAIEACPSILVKTFGWKEIKHFYGFTCLIPPYYVGFNFSAPNSSHDENKHYFIDIKQVIKHLRRYGNRQPKSVDHLKKDLNDYGYKFQFTPLTLLKGPFLSSGSKTVWTRKCSFKGKGWKKQIIDGKECIQNNDEDLLFLDKDYFFDINQIADYIIENAEEEDRPVKEDLVYYEPLNL